MSEVNSYSYIAKIIFKITHSKDSKSKTFQPRLKNYNQMFRNICQYFVSYCILPKSVKIGFKISLGDDRLWKVFLLTPSHIVLLFLSRVNKGSPFEILIESPLQFQL